MKLKSEWPGKEVLKGLSNYKPGTHLAPLRMISGWLCDWNTFSITYNDKGEPESCDSGEDLILLTNNRYKKNLIINLGCYCLDDPMFQVVMIYKGDDWIPKNYIAFYETPNVNDAIECVNRWMFIGTKAANEKFEP